MHFDVYDGCPSSECEVILLDFLSCTFVSVFTLCAFFVNFRHFLFSAMMDVQSECEVIPRDFLCCKLCEEEYKLPKYLVCFHSFCQSCIGGYVTEHGQQEFYWCPICGTETVIDGLGKMSCTFSFLLTLLMLTLCEGLVHL